MILPLSRGTGDEAAMTGAGKTRVVLFLFNRPQSLAQVVEAVLRAPPKLVFAIADGPRVDRPGEADLCTAARAVVSRLDGACKVVRDFSDTNLGCSGRILSGLDRVFDK